MQVAGAVRSPFRKSALTALYQRSHGVPRLINIIADRALVGAYASETTEIGAKLVHAAADEVQLGEPGIRRIHWRWLAAAAAGLALAVLTWNAMRPIEGPGVGQVEDIIAVETQVPGTQIDQQPAQEAAPELPVPAAPAGLDENWLEIQHQTAFGGLATLWNEPGGGASIRAACDGGEFSGWACLRSDGSLARIRQLGLPVILQLRGNAPQMLLLQGIQAERLLAGTPGATLSVSRREIEDRWFGEYIVAWPQAADWPREITRGDAGPAVETVLRLAAMAEEPYSGAASFDTDFESWLLAFQSRYGLETDGIVGPKTLLYLIRPSVSEPGLKTDWPESDRQAGS
jgi:general secretion pathway protein A